MTASKAGPATFPTAKSESSLAASRTRTGPQKRNSLVISRMEARFQKLAPELIEIDAMLGNFTVREEKHRHIKVVTFVQCGVGINIDLAQSSATFRKQRRDLRFCLIA